MAAFFCESIWSGIEFTDKVGLPVTVALVALILLIAIGVNVVPAVTGRWQTEYSTRDLTYGSVCLALGYALSWVKLFEMPLGGSVTLAALAPCFIYCYYFGFRKSTVFAAAYMLLQFTQPVYICHPLSALLDYIFPYFAICLVGLFGYRPERYAAFIKRNKDRGAAKRWAYTVGGHWKIFVAALIYISVKYVSSVISGVVCWDYWGYEATPLIGKLTFSLGYNSFALVDGAIALAATLGLMSSRALNSYMTAAFARRRGEEAPECEDGQSAAQTEEGSEQKSDKI